jgi:hypothetical protein
MRTLSENYEAPQFTWDYWTHKGQPRLILKLKPENRIFSDLIQNLQDPEWVAALRQCSDFDCRTFILSNSKWAEKGNKFCIEECKKRYHGRKHKEKKKEKKTIEAIERELEFKKIECPSVSDNPDRIRINKKKFEVVMRCEAISELGERCNYMILGGEFDTYLKDYSGPEKCPNCDTAGLRHFLTTSNREEEYEYTASAWEELIKKYKFEKGGGHNNDMAKD